MPSPQAGFPAARTLRWTAFVLAAIATAAVACAAFAPVRVDSPDVVFEIPNGTWARRMAGNKLEILPSQIRLTLGVRDILVLRNQDDVPQVFGPTLMMPGQSFRLPFAVASEYQFACTAHASGQMTIIVDPRPDSAWTRFVWRVRAAKEQIWR